MKDDNTTRIRVVHGDFPVGDTNWEEFDFLTDEEVELGALSDPDALPTEPEALTLFRRVSEVQQIRERLSLSQEEFAEVFHLPLETIQNWEQSRQRPDPVASVLLKVIERTPDVVREALAAA